MDFELLILFFFIAMLYASVGFGGGSSYLALLALYGIDFLMLRSTALLCNITVVSGGAFIFHKNGFLKWKKILPLIAVSIPMAYLGGRLPLQQEVFFVLLGMTLLAAAFLMWWRKTEVETVETSHQMVWYKNAVLGGSIGFLAGVVGIGGGIFLAPILHLLRWDSPKVIAATASIFILVNSLSGLAGQFAHPDFSIDWNFALPLIIAVLLGGQLGARLSANRFNQQYVRRATAVLVAFVGVRILFKYLPMVGW